MTEYATIQTTAVVLQPIPPSSAPLGSLYNDSTNSNAFSNMSTSGANQQIGATTTSFIIKMKFNNTGSPLPAYKRVALLSDGSVCLADSDNVSAMIDIGLTVDPIPAGEFGRVMLNAANADGVLTGLGFTPGQAIFLSKTPGGLTSDVGSFDPVTDTIMRVGVADCANNETSSSATDLIMAVEVYSRPGGA